MARGSVVEKPTNPNELVLEAWAQGLLVGSLVILSFITLANMRRGVLLHKVSAEPRLHTRNTTNTNSAHSARTHSRYLAGLLAVFQISRPCLVVVSGCHIPQCILVSAQRHRLDENQAFLV
jgi:hypothetical protein